MYYLNFQVIGVYDEQGNFGGAGADDILYIPLQTAQKKILGVDYLLVGIIQIENPDLIESTSEQIKTGLRLLKKLGIITVKHWTVVVTPKYARAIQDY